MSEENKAQRTITGRVVSDKMDKSVSVAIGTDHLTPWQGCYRSSQLLGSKHKRFILSSSGHIASLVNPPGNPKASYFVGPNADMDAGEWQSQAQQCQGSWWEDWIVWAGARSGEKKRAPRRLGSARHPELVAAPGTYIYG